MNRKKIIIDIEDDLPTKTALRLVGQVIDAGRMSQTGPYRQFCFCTTFKNGLQVVARPKRSAATDSFRVEKTVELLEREQSE